MKKIKVYFCQFHQYSLICRIFASIYNAESKYKKGDYNMESYLDKFIRKYVRKINPMWYLYYCWRKNYSDKRLDDFIQKYYTLENKEIASIKKEMRKYGLIYLKM